MVSVETFPASSAILHASVPMYTLDMVAPPNPLTFLETFFKGPIKSFRSLEMHAEQRLSIPMRNESVSKDVMAVLPSGEVVALYAITDITWRSEDILGVHVSGGLPG
jgi:hypothetical protein